MSYRLLATAFLAVSVAVVSARAEEVYSGPIRADVVRVVDGDTIVVHARPWPGQIVETAVRVRDIDTPELHSSCPAEREAAAAARDAVSRLVKEGDEVSLYRISGDKYFGRVVADITLPDDSSLAATLLSHGLAVHYDGGRKTPFPCPAS